ncbi:hypothetical protein [Paraburkholderia terrae]|uniref:hypothetical protein n=1 Tax=Paraburkholderia terrae TaxID=311230 RepID=UPI0020710995|nr:hypothetical protein [Paraburkholderia terrae]BDC37925.1 hypothetical protein PTKU15_12220 [Paraburkholderia terrae]
MGILDNLFGGNSSTPDDSADATTASPSWSDNLANNMGGGSASMYTPEQKHAAAMNALMSMGIAMMKASAPSADPAHSNFGYALANGLEGGMQGYQGSLQNAMQNQANVYKMNQLRNQAAIAEQIGGGMGGASQAQPTATPYDAKFSLSTLKGANGAAIGGAPQLGSPGGGYALPDNASIDVKDYGTKQDDPATAQYKAAQANPWLIPGVDPVVAKGMYLSDPAGYQKALIESRKQTDFQKQAADAYGYGTPEYQAAVRANVDKQGTLTLRPGGAYRGADGVLHYVNSAAPAGFTYNDAGEMVPISGGLEGVRTSQRVTLQGKNDATIAPTQYDAQGNPMPTTSVSGVLGQEPGTFQMPGAGQGAPQGAPQSAPQGASQGSAVPVGIRNNNPGNIRNADGTFRQYADMATGQQAAYDNLSAYATKHGINTVAGAITRWAPPNENDTQAYIADVARRTGLDPNQKIDLTNPQVQRLVGGAIFAHENGAYPAPQAQQATQGAPQLAPQTSPQGQQAFPVAPGTKPVYYSAPPQGAKAGAESASSGRADTMNKQYEDMAKRDSDYQQTMTNLGQMRQISQGQNLFGRLGAMIPGDVGALANSNQATYQKLRASALMNMAPGGTGTDASRATVDQSLPDYDKPQATQLAGIDNAAGQVTLNHVKRQFLNPIYNSRDADAFTQKSAEFDQNVTPSMARVLTIPDIAQRKAAVNAMIQQNPAYKPGFQWALTNGLLNK